MSKNKQNIVDEAITDHLKANDPDAEVRANYWRNQWEELVKQNDHSRKEGKRMALITRLLCYTIYICNAVWTVTQLCGYDASEPWDTTQRLLWCLVLALNVGFAVFVAMTRLVMRIDKDRIDQGWEANKTILEMKGKLDVAEHNAEELQNEVDWLKSVNAVLEEENQKNQKTKK